VPQKAPLASTRRVRALDSLNPEVHSLPRRRKNSGRRQQIQGEAMNSSAVLRGVSLSLKNMVYGAFEK
jgi:hypothetical protein